jgi:N utilization substance protein A
MNRELLLLVDALAREKNVAKEIVFTALESALPRRRRSASPDEIDARVSINRETGDYDSFRRWTVVPDEEHEEPAYQLAITDAAARDPALKLGDVIEEAARARGVRPHRRAGGKAGDPAEDPRRRARADPQRLSSSARTIC